MIDTIETTFGQFIEILRKEKKFRKWFIIIITFILIISILGIIFHKQIFDEENLKNGLEIFKISTFITGLFLVLSLASFTNIKIGNKRLTIQLEGLRNERAKIKERIERQKDNVLDTIQLSLNQLTEYYTINLNQAKSSYRWSITAILAGLITLVTGIWLIYFNERPNYNLAFITGVSGILIEFIGASNILIYNKSIKQLNIYFKELIKIQDTMLAIELCEEIDPNNEKKLEIKEKIITSLISRSSN